MKKRFRLEPHKIVFIVFIFALIYILVYEFVLMQFPATSKTTYTIGVITSRIFYSIIAACIFYFLSNYFPLYLPRQKRKRNVLFNAYQKVILIQAHISGLKVNLDIFNDEFENSQWFRDRLASINTTAPVDRFTSWYLYLSHLKKNLLEIIQSMTIHSEYLSTEFFHELILFERELLSPYTFEDDRTLLVDTLEFAEINLQQVLFHTKHLLELRQKEFSKYEKDFAKDGAEYRKERYDPLISKLAK